MRQALVVWGMLIALATVAGAGSAEPGDIVTVDADAHGADHPCPVIASYSACPFVLDSNGTSSPGDDQVESTVFVDEVQAKVRPPGDVLPTQEIVFEPSDLVIHHPLYDDLDQAWLGVNDSRPGPTRAYAEFESGSYRTGCYERDDSKPGIMLVVYPPAPYDSLEPCSHTTPFQFCWDPCYFYDETYAQQTNDTITPFPYGLFLRNEDGNDIGTDNYVDAYVWGAENCYWISQIPCDSSAVSSSLNSTEQEYHNTTPDVEAGFQFNRTVVGVDTSDSPLGEKYGLVALAMAPFEWQTPLKSSPDSDLRPPDIPSKFPISTPPSTASPSYRITEIAPPHVASASKNAYPSPRTTLILVAAGVSTTILAVVAWTLYHRLNKREGLQQATRSRIHKTLVETPGLRAAELAAHLSLDKTTIKYHLEKMVMWGQVRSSTGARPRYFVIQCTEDSRIVEALAQPTLREVHSALQRLGEADHSTLAASAKLSNAAISRAVAKLAAAGLVTQTRAGRRTVVRPVASFTGTRGDSAAAEQPN